MQHQLSEFKKSSSLLCYPNSSKNLVRFNISATQPLCNQYSILTITGDVVSEARPISNNQIDMTQLPAGRYVIQITSEDLREARSIDKE